MLYVCCAVAIIKKEWALAKINLFFYFWMLVWSVKPGTHPYKKYKINLFCALRYLFYFLQNCLRKKLFNVLPSTLKYVLKAGTDVAILGLWIIFLDFSKFNCMLKNT